MEAMFQEAAFRMVLAILLGSIVGVERELTLKSAGLRTHILVCLGATVFTLVSLSDLSQAMVPATTSGATYDIRINRDPARIAAQIVTGIGFIGGGAVLRHGNSVRGLTTAASLWLMASIGMLVGSGQYRLSLVVTLMTFLVLFTIGHLERSVFAKHLKGFNRLDLKLTVARTELDTVQTWLARHLSKEIVELTAFQESDIEPTAPTVVAPGGATAASEGQGTLVAPSVPQVSMATLQEPLPQVRLTYVFQVSHAQIDIAQLSRQLHQMAGVRAVEIRVLPASEV
jgi:putative Mg2+ transporter-C (MgtC) family protein